MDRAKRTQLIEQIRRVGLPDENGLPLVALEDFFEGNDDEGSIGCNLMPHPGIPLFYEELKKIRVRGNVSSVLIGIYEVEEEVESMWPFSETVFVVTSEDPIKVSEWFDPLRPDSVGPHMTGARNSPEIPKGHEIRVAWWD